MDEFKEDLMFSNDSDCLEQIHMDSMSISDVNLADILISKYDYLDSCISNETFDASLCSNLVMLLKFILENGIHLDEDLNHREQMDMFFTLFRNILRNNLRCLPDSINLLILRLIEIRASKWKLACNIEEYYLNKVDQLSTTNNTGSNQSCVAGQKMSRNNGAAFRSFGDSSTDDLPFRNSRLLKTNSKGVIKDEVLIKNSDSGKVMGIKGRRVHMIEEMSDTIISFQKVSPSSKERMVQITGYNRENIEKAKNLIEVTIRQNISPIPMPMPMSLDNHNDCADDESLFLVQQCSNTINNDGGNLSDHGNHPYSFALNALNKSVNIQVSDPVVGRKLQQFLNKFRFTDFVSNNLKGQTEVKVQDEDRTPSRIIYDRQFLINIKHSIKEKVDPVLIDHIKLKQPDLLRIPKQQPNQT